MYGTVQSLVAANLLIYKALSSQDILRSARNEDEIWGCYQTAERALPYRPHPGCSLASRPSTMISMSWLVMGWVGRKRGVLIIESSVGRGP